jgi:hypothetical protein
MINWLVLIKIKDNCWKTFNLIKRYSDSVNLKDKLLTQADFAKGL